MNEPTQDEIQAANAAALQLSEKTIQRIQNTDSRAQRDFLVNMAVSIIEASPASPSFAFQECERPMWKA